MLSTLEQKIVDCLIASHPKGMNANAIAGQIGEKPAYVMNALGHMREQAYQADGKWYARGIKAQPTTKGQTSPVATPLVTIPKPNIPFPPKLKEPAPYKPFLSVGEYLFEFCVKKIVDKKDLWFFKNKKILGRGASQPIIDNSGEVNYLLSRRVELITILRE